MKRKHFSAVLTLLLALSFAAPLFAQQFTAVQRKRLLTIISQWVTNGEVLGGPGGGAINTVWGCATSDCSVLTASPGDSLDAGSADSSSPATRSTSLPATCTEGQMHQDTNSGGSETYICTDGNTWTKLAATTDTAPLATALAANGANCSAGQFPLGVDASGAAESCTALPTTIVGTANQITASAATGTVTLSIPTSPTLPGTTTGTFSGNITGNVTGNVSGNAGTATALAANGANCTAGQFPLGVDASGAVEGCTSISSALQTPWVGNINAAGFTLFGDSTSGGTLTIGSTSHATKGKILFGTSAYDEVNNRLGIETASPTVPLDVVGAINVTGQITSTVATGTAPFIVASTTNVANLNASSLNGATMAAPGAIGGGTPAAGTFTTVTATTGVASGGADASKCSGTAGCQTWGQGTAAGDPAANTILFQAPAAVTAYGRTWAGAAVTGYSKWTSNGATPPVSTETFVNTWTKSVYFPAGSLSTDGTQCAAPAEVTINSGSKRWTIICADNDASTIYGEAEMPDSWDGGTVTLMGSFIQTAADTNALNADVAMACRASADTINNTWGTEIAMDITNMSGSNKIDKVTTAAITPNGTCTGGGKLLQFRWQMDATGTTTAVATLHVVGFKLEYGVTGLTD